MRTGTSKNALFPRLRRRLRARILMYTLYTPVLRARSPSTHEKITIFRGARKLIYTLIFLLFSHAVFSEASDSLIEGLDGQKHSLSDYVGKGKWVVVSVWGTACPYCRAELDTLIDFHDQHHDKDAIVIGLTLDWPTFNFPDKESLHEFALDYFIEFPLLMVDAELASKVIGKPVNMIPLTFFYNPDGDLVLRINGVVTNEQLEKVIKDARTRYHVEWADEVPPEFKPE